MLQEQHLNQARPQAARIATPTATLPDPVNTNTGEAQPSLKSELPHSSAPNGPTEENSSDTSVSDLAELTEGGSLSQNPRAAITRSKLDHSAGHTVSNPSRPSHGPKVVNIKIKPHGKGNKNTHHLFSKAAAEMATRFPECVEAVDGTREEQTVVCSRSRSQPARDTLHHRDILMRLGRLEEWQHAESMGKINKVCSTLICR